MQTEATKDGSRKLWLNRSEYRDLLERIDDWEKEIAVRLMGESGLRVGEVVGVSYNDVNRTEDGEHYLLTVTGAKDTTGEYDDGKARETWLPTDLEKDIFRYVDVHDIAPDTPIIKKEPRTIQYWVKSLGASMVLHDENPTWEHLSCHDLRRHWVHYHSDERGVNPRVLMQLGGWNSFAGIRPYLAKPSEETIVENMRGN